METATRADDESAGDLVVEAHQPVQPRPRPDQHHDHRRRQIRGQFLGHPPRLRLDVHAVRWGWEVGRFFGDVNADSTDEEPLATAPQHPVFRITVRK